MRIASVLTTGNSRALIFRTAAAGISRMVRSPGALIEVAAEAAEIPERSGRECARGSPAAQTMVVAKLNDFFREFWLCDLPMTYPGAF